MRQEDDEDDGGAGGLGTVRYPCMPSLVALQQMKNRLHMAYLGKKLMKWTAMATGREIRRVVHEIVHAYSGYEDDLPECYIYLSRCRFYYPNLNKMVLSNHAFKARLRVVTAHRSVAACSFYSFEIIDNGVDQYLHLGLDKGGQIIDETKQKWINLLNRLVVLLNLRTAFTQIDNENRAATKKMNVLSKIVIPRTHATIHYILLELEEMSREDFFRLKCVLKNKRRQKETRDKQRKRDEVNTVAETPITVTETPITVAETPITVAETPITITETPIALPETPITIAETALTETPIIVTVTSLSMTKISLAVIETPLPLTETPAASKAVKIPELNNLKDALAVEMRDVLEETKESDLKQAEPTIKIKKHPSEEEASNVSLDEIDKCEMLIMILTSLRDLIIRMLVANDIDDKADEIDDNLTNKEPIIQDTCACVENNAEPSNDLELDTQKLIEELNIFKAAALESLLGNDEMVHTETERATEIPYNECHKEDVLKHSKIKTPPSRKESVKQKRLELGYFEKSVQKIKRVIRTQDPDGTIIEKKETIVIKQKRHYPNEAVVDDVFNENATCEHLYNDLDNINLKTDCSCEGEKSELDDLKKSITDVENINRDDKTNTQINNEIDEFLDSCKEFKTIVDVYTKEDEFERLDLLKSQLSEVEELTTDFKTEDIEGLEAFLLSCKHFKAKIDEYKKKERMRKTSPSVAILKEQLDQTIELTKEAARKGFLTESLLDFVETCQKVKFKLDTSPNAKNKTLKQLKENIGNVISAIHKRECSVKDLLTVCEVSSATCEIEPKTSDKAKENESIKDEYEQLNLYDESDLCRNICNPFERTENEQDTCNPCIKDLDVAQIEKLSRKSIYSSESVKPVVSFAEPLIQDSESSCEEIIHKLQRITRTRVDGFIDRNQNVLVKEERDDVSEVKRNIGDDTECGCEIEGAEICDECALNEVNNVSSKTIDFDTVISKDVLNDRISTNSKVERKQFNSKESMKPTKSNDFDKGFVQKSRHKINRIIRTKNLDGSITEKEDKFGTRETEAGAKGGESGNDADDDQGEDEIYEELLQKAESLENSVLKSMVLKMSERYRNTLSKPDEDDVLVKLEATDQSSETDCCSSDIKKK